eukprot:jgi/Mesen1/2472/ME000158S01672
MSVCSKTRMRRRRRFGRGGDREGRSEGGPGGAGGDDEWAVEEEDEEGGEGAGSTTVGGAAGAGAYPQGLPRFIRDSFFVHVFTASTHKLVLKKGPGGEATEGQGQPSCSVCLAEYRVGEHLRQLPGCNHCFHRGCIDLWLDTHTTCPLCRASLVEFFPTRRAPPPFPLLWSLPIAPSTAGLTVGARWPRLQQLSPPPTADGSGGVLRGPGGGGYQVATSDPSLAHALAAPEVLDGAGAEAGVQMRGELTGGTLLGPACQGRQEEEHVIAIDEGNRSGTQTKDGPPGVDSTDVIIPAHVIVSLAGPVENGPGVSAGVIGPADAGELLALAGPEVNAPMQAGGDREPLPLENMLTDRSEQAAPLGDVDAAEAAGAHDVVPSHQPSP